MAKEKAIKTDVTTNPIQETTDAQNQTMNSGGLENFDNEPEPANQENRRSASQQGKKRGPYNRSGQYSAKNQPVDFSALVSAEMFSGMFSAFSEIIASRAGEKWRLTPDEISSLSMAFAPLAAKYGQDFAKWLPEITFATAVLNVVMRRIGQK